MVMTMVMDRTNRTVPREELRRRIFDAAIAVFRERGFERATIEEVTLRARVAKGTFFNFYPTKFDVLAEYYRAVDIRIMEARAAMDPAEPAAALADFAVKAEKILRQEGTLVLDLLVAALANRNLRDIDYASGDADEAQFAAFFETARRLGSVHPAIDPRKVAGVVLDIWSGAMRRWVNANGSPPLAAMFAEKIQVVFMGLRGEGERCAGANSFVR